MFSVLRNRLGIPGIVSVVALVFALVGGAYAANGGNPGPGASASAQAKRGPRGPRGPAGPVGPAGATGPMGSAGANGKDGANGTNGANGKDGKDGEDGQSVTSETLAMGNEHCPAGGSEFESASGITYACSGQEGKAGKDGQEGKEGKEGSPWTVDGTLPSGKSLKGQLSAFWAAYGVQASTISFGIPLKEAPTIKFMQEGEAAKSGCSGDASNPGASPGFLCVFTAFAGPTKPVEVLQTFPTPYGATLFLNTEDAKSEEVALVAVWAVTAK